MSGAVTISVDGTFRTLNQGDTIKFGDVEFKIISITPAGKPSDVVHASIAERFSNREFLDLEDPFEAAVFELVQMNRRKRRDYAVDGDPFSNFRETADQLGLAVWEAAEFNLAQKLARLKSLRANGRMEEPSNESVGDTYLDAAVYAVIMYAIYRSSQVKIGKVSS